MQIVFLSEMSDKVDGYFAFYDHDERYTNDARCINVKEFLHDNLDQWLDDIHKSHSKIAKKFLKYTRWWWVTPLARLDLRPWGREPIFKPMLFARAILEWSDNINNAGKIYIIGQEPLVATYLEEFDKTITIQGIELKQYQFLLIIIKKCKLAFASFIRIFLHAFHILKDNVLSGRPENRSKTIILFEMFSNDFSLEETYQHYYGTLFSHVDQKNIGRCCIGMEKKKTKIDLSSPCFYLLDYLSLKMFIKSIIRNIKLILISFFFSFLNMHCFVGRRKSTILWQSYFLICLEQMSCFQEICSFEAMKAFLAEGHCKKIVYPYEEKGIEKAILLATTAQKIQTIGYLQHPAHRLALSFMDVHPPISLKPSKYAVCGSEYIRYLEQWAQKKKSLISVWGSEKTLQDEYKTGESLPHHLKILVLISHPNEVSTFHSWLKSEVRLTVGTSYFVRNYKAGGLNKFSNQLDNLIMEFNCVQESNGSLLEDIDSCDVSIFCGTSAGLIAVNRGQLVFHVALDNFFKMNPCLDQLASMLPCESAKQFADRIDTIRDLDSDSINKLRQKQYTFSRTVFSKIEHETIKNDILC
ncbi:MAG: hypothetical protein ABIJ59_06420 [Pseudomonadota bacterium]